MNSSKNRIYLDHAAGAPLGDAAQQAMAQGLREGVGNPSSLHHEGRKARQQIEEARSHVARFAACEPDEIIFTSGGAEANRLAMEGAALASPQGILMSSQADHPSILGCLEDLQKRGRRVECLPVDSDGLLDVSSLGNQTIPVSSEVSGGIFSLLWISNEVGTIQDLESMIKASKAKEFILHVDAVQAAGKINLNLLKQVPLISISSHKIGGPAGVGALVVRRGARWMAPWTGGKQEAGRRPGTEAKILLGGFSAAVQAVSQGTHGTVERARAEEKFLQILDENQIAYTINGSRGVRHCPGILNLSFSRWYGDQLVAALDLEGISVSPGAACSSGVVRSSHVLQAMGRQGDEARRGVRFSWGSTPDPHECEDAARRVVKVVRRKANLSAQRVLA